MEVDGGPTQEAADGTCVAAVPKAAVPEHVPQVTGPRPWAADVEHRSSDFTALLDVHVSQRIKAAARWSAPSERLKWSARSGSKMTAAVGLTRCCRGPGGDGDNEKAASERVPASLHPNPQEVPQSRD